MLIPGRCGWAGMGVQPVPRGHVLLRSGRPSVLSSSEQRRCLQQLGKYFASSGVQELSDGLRVSRDPLSGR